MNLDDLPYYDCKFTDVVAVKKFAFIVENGVIQKGRSNLDGIGEGEVGRSSFVGVTARNRTTIKSVFELISTRIGVDEFFFFENGFEGIVAVVETEGNAKGFFVNCRNSLIVDGAEIDLAFMFGNDEAYYLRPNGFEFLLDNFTLHSEYEYIREYNCDVGLFVNAHRV